MIREIVGDLLYGKKRALIHRDFQPQMLRTQEAHDDFCKNGYALLKNVLQPAEIKQLTSLFAEVKNHPGYETYDYYRNSMAFKDSALKKYILEQSMNIASPVLSGFINMDRVIFPMGGAFCINPPRAKRGSPPHQDPTMTDEIDSYAMTIWIALSDTSLENGCLHVVPGSHLWGNIHRSITMPWALDKFRDEVWKYMIPLEMKAGDVLCFDVSTIHGSTPNRSAELRLAMNYIALPKDKSLMNYYPISSGKASSRAELYKIDSNYFLEESQFERPSSRYPMVNKIEWNNYYSQNNIAELLREYKNKNSR